MEVTLVMHHPRVGRRACFQLDLEGAGCVPRGCDMRRVGFHNPFNNLKTGAKAMS